MSPPADPAQIAASDDPGLLARTAGTDLRPDAQLACARNPHTTAATLIVLASSPDPAVALAASDHPNVPATTRTRVRDRLSGRVRPAA